MDCSYDEGFATEDDWFQHEIDKHRRQWECLLCTLTFRDSNKLCGHLKSSHSGCFTSSRLQILLKACEKGQIPFTEILCPLCDHWEPALFRAEEQSEMYKSHVASHLRWIALQSLPGLLVGLECDAVGSNVDLTTVGNDQQSTEARAERNESLAREPSVTHYGGSLPSISLESDPATWISQGGAPELLTSSSNRSRLLRPRVQSRDAAISRGLSAVSGSQQIDRAQQPVFDEYGRPSMAPRTGKQPTYWSCSNCGMGPLPHSSTDVCVFCSHIRCSHCPHVRYQV